MTAPEKAAEPCPERFRKGQAQRILRVVDLGELARGVMKVAHFPRRSEGELVVAQENQGRDRRADSEERQVVEPALAANALDQKVEAQDRRDRSDVELDHGGISGQKPGEKHESRPAARAFFQSRKNEVNSANAVAWWP